MLEVIWFILWGVLWAIYFTLDGFDLGLGTLLPFIVKNDKDKRIVYNAMGPFWDGNEVWLITAGGVTFAAFPTAYAVMFSALYTPLLLILFALIFRGISFEFRGKIDSPVWRMIWDGCLTVGSFAAALLFGVAFANIFQGVPLDGAGLFQGNLLTLLNVYGLLGGLFFLSLFLIHGSLWLSIRSEGDLSTRATGFALRLWPITLGISASFLAASALLTPLYNNYLAHPVLFIIPLITVCSLAFLRVFLEKNPWKAWFASSITIFSSVLFGVVGLFPNLLPSNISPKFSMTIYNSASSQLTLKIMLCVVLVCVPIVIIYQTWIYRLFSYKITDSDLAPDESY
jgi:cytochrome bd ubiquinol oxidase subunit II